jgi:hypothetical protein
VPDHVVDLAKFKNQGTGQFYLDPIVTYMEKFFTAEPQSISGITFVLQDCLEVSVVKIILEINH